MPTVSPPSRDATLDAAVFWFRHKTELLAALLMLVLGGAGFAGYRLYADRRDSAAAEFLGKAKTIPNIARLSIAILEHRPVRRLIYFWRTRIGRKRIFSKPTPRYRLFSTNSPSMSLRALRGWGWPQILSRWGSRMKRSRSCRNWWRVIRKVLSLPLALLSQVHLLKAKGKIGGGAARLRKFSDAISRKLSCGRSIARAAIAEAGERGQTLAFPQPRTRLSFRALPPRRRQPCHQIPRRRSRNVAAARRRRHLFRFAAWHSRHYIGGRITASRIGSVYERPVGRISFALSFSDRA